MILGISGEAGYIWGLGEDVRINDRFFVGGSNLRGFERAGIGPRDANGDALGGQPLCGRLGRTDVPLGLPEELGLKGRAFGDVGTLGEVDIDPGPARSHQRYRIAPRVAGRRAVLGLSVRPRAARPRLSGPGEEDFDKTENFRFSFGTRFCT